MEQKDYILREIEKISTLLMYLIGKFIPAKSIEEQQLTEELINKELKERYGNDLDYILSLEETDFEIILTQNKGFNFENLELLADLLFTIGNDDFESKTNYLKKALELYEYIDKKSKTFSFERISKIEEIKKLLI